MSFGKKHRPLWQAVVFMLVLWEAGWFLASGRSCIQQMLTAAQYYIDWSTGADTNDALGWGTPMKTLDQVTKNLGNGDAVYCAESSDPTSIGNALWTAGDRSVILSTACAALMYACDGTGIWYKVDANCTPTQSTTMKEGTHSASLAIGVSATTGVMATANLNANLDCSGYQQISFWVRADGTLVASRLALAMYSDDYPTSALTNLVGKAYIPSVPTPNLWQPVTVDYGGALGTVRTIALIVETDPGTRTVLIDDILACKDDAEADSLTLTSLISKNTTNEPWFALASINGTAVELESINAVPSSTIGSYGGTTDTVTTYKRETWKTTPVPAAATAVQTISDSGAAGAPIQVLGGYANGQDVTTTPTGLTIYDGANGYGYGIYATGKSYVTLSRLGAARYNYPILFFSSGTGNSADTCYTAASANAGLYFGGQTTPTATNIYVSAATATGGLYWYNCTAGAASDVYCHGSAPGIAVDGGLRNVFSRCDSRSTAATSSIWLTNTQEWSRWVDCSAVGASLGTYGLYMSANYAPATFVNFTSSGHTTGGVSLAAQGADISMSDSSIAEATEVVFTDSAGRSYALSSTNHDDAPGSHYRWEYGATYNSTQAVRHTASGWAWQLSPTNAARSSTWPLRLPIGQVALTSGVANTVTCWMQRSNTGLTGGLVCPGGQITGIAADVSDTTWTVAAGEWEQQSIELTSTEDGVVTIEAQASGGTTYSLYVDDEAATGTATFTGLDWGTGAGAAYLNTAAGGASAVTRVTGGVQ